MTKIDYDALDAVAEALEGDWVAEGRGLDEGFSHWGTRGTLTRSDINCTKENHHDRHQ